MRHPARLEPRGWPCAYSGRVSHGNCTLIAVRYCPICDPGGGEPRPCPQNWQKCLNCNQLHADLLKPIIPDLQPGGRAGRRRGATRWAAALAAALALCAYGAGAQNGTAAYAQTGDVDLQAMFTGGPGALPIPLVAHFLQQDSGGSGPRDGPGMSERVQLAHTRASPEIVTARQESAAEPETARAAIAIAGDTGTLTILFDGGIDASTVNSSRIHIRDGFAASGGTTLAGDALDAGSNSVTVNIGAAGLLEIRGYANPRIHFDAEALLSARGTPFPKPFELPRPRHLESFPLSDIEENPGGMAFAPDGGRMFTSGGTGNVRQYDLDPPFSIDTIPNSARSVTKLPAATGPSGTTTGLYGTEDDLAGLTFDPSGGTLYVIGDDTNTIRQYSLDTQYDIEDGITFAGLFDVGGEAPEPEAVELGPGGINMYVAAAGDDASIYRYVLAEAFNVSTASYTGDSLSVLSNETRPTGARISPDGSALYVVGERAQNGPDSVFRYDLSLPFDITSATYAGRFPSVAESTMRDLVFADGGMRLYITGHLTRSIHHYNLPSPYEIELPASAVLNVGSDQGLPEGSAFSGDGRHLFVTGRAGPNGMIHRYPLDIPYDLAAAGAFDQLFQAAPRETKPRDVEFSTDGMMMFTIGHSDNIVRFNLSAPYDIGTGSPPVFAGSSAVTFGGNAIDISAQDATGLEFSPDGTYMYVTANNGIIQYVLGTQYDASSASSESFFDTRLQPLSDGEYTEQQPADVAFSPNGTRMFVSGDRINAVHTYVLPDPFDLSTATHEIHDGLFNLADFGNNIRGLEFSADGLRMVVTFENPDALVEYSSATYPVDVIPESTNRPRIVTSSVDPRTDALGLVFDREIGSVNASKIYLAGAPGHSGGTVLGGSTVSINGTTARLDLPAGTAALYADPVLRFDPGAVLGSSGGSFPEPYDIIRPAYRSTSDLAGAAPTGLDFSGDGTRMFVSGGGSIQQYDLLSPYLPAGAIPAGSFSVVQQEASPTGVVLSEDGRRMTVSGGTSVHEYYLDPPFDVTGARHVESSNPGATAGDLLFSPGGTKMFIVGGGAVTGYDLDAPYIASSAVQADALDVSAQDAAPTGAALSPDGTVLIVSGGGGSAYRYLLGSPFGLAGSTHNGTFALAEGDPTGIALTPGGQTMLVSGGGVHSYELAEPYSLSGPAEVAEFDAGAEDGSITGAAFSPDGLNMFIAGQDGSAVISNSLSAPFDISTASIVDSSAVEGNPESVAFAADGMTMFVLSSQSDTIHAYALDAPFDIGNLQEAGSFDVSGQEAVPRGMTFAAGGTRLFITGTSSDMVHGYTLDAPFDIGNPQLAGSFSVFEQDRRPRGVAFAEGGLRMFVSGSFENAVQVYSLENPYDLDTVSHEGLVGIDSETFTQDVAFSTGGLGMYVTGGLRDSVIQYWPSLHHLSICEQDEELASGVCHAPSDSLLADADDAPVVSSTVLYKFSVSPRDAPVVEDRLRMETLFGSDAPGITERPVISYEIPGMVSAELDLETRLLLVTFDTAAVPLVSDGALAYVRDGISAFGGVVLENRTAGFSTLEFNLSSDESRMIQGYTDPRLHFGPNTCPGPTPLRSPCRLCFPRLSPRTTGWNQVKPRTGRTFRPMEQSW
ncbi:hypothetical protein CENSYa_0819 [Cenarchaeum symbiosum A]|uniref:Uncharacterized protein n=1 Tax=Cenarchaeum symbiosum (strain A) TaxID=414004 RepID=A0RVT5_CENSY|nr:hypothetical protein CENSYa_0819 [Cenarchaeum symbiosum A]